MKTRDGFVSNSSSSSFVVAFPELPKSAAHVRKMMFGDDRTFPNPYPSENRAQEFSTLKIAKTVFNDIQNQKPNDNKNIIEGFGGWLPGAPEGPDTYNRKDLTDAQKRKMFADWEKEYNKYQKDTAMSFVEKHKDVFIYTFEYSDNDGDYFCTLEHGGIFDKLKHVQISRH